MSLRKVSETCHSIIFFLKGKLPINHNVFLDEKEILDLNNTSGKLSRDCRLWPVSCKLNGLLIKVMASCSITMLGLNVVDFYVVALKMLALGVCSIFLISETTKRPKRFRVIELLSYGYIR